MPSTKTAATSASDFAMRAFWGLEVPKGPNGVTFPVEDCDRLNVSNVALGSEVRFRAA